MKIIIEFNRFLFESCNRTLISKFNTTISKDLFWTVYKIARTQAIINQTKLNIDNQTRNVTNEL